MMMSLLFPFVGVAAFASCHLAPFFFTSQQSVLLSAGAVHVKERFFPPEQGAGTAEPLFLFPPPNLLSTAYSRDHDRSLRTEAKQNVISGSFLHFRDLRGREEDTRNVQPSEGRFQRWGRRLRERGARIRRALGRFFGRRRRGRSDEARDQGRRRRVKYEEPVLSYDDAFAYLRTPPPTPPQSLREKREVTSGSRETSLPTPEEDESLPPLRAPSPTPSELTPAEDLLSAPGALEEEVQKLKSVSDTLLLRSASLSRLRRKLAELTTPFPEEETHPSIGEERERRAAELREMLRRSSESLDQLVSAQGERIQRILAAVESVEDQARAREISEATTEPLNVLQRITSELER